MSAQSETICRQPRGPIIAAAFVLAMNILITLAGVAWMIAFAYDLNRHGPGWFGGLFLLMGSGIQITAQLLLGLLPSLAVSKHAKTISADFRDWVLWNGIYGFAIILICVFGLIGFAILGDLPTGGPGA